MSRGNNAGRHQTGGGPPAGDTAMQETGLKRGTLLGLRADALTAISAIVVSIIVSRGLGPDQRGVYFVAFTTATMLALFGNLGMTMASMVFASKREVPLAELHGATLLASLTVGALAAALLLALEDVLTSSILPGLDTLMLVMVGVGVIPLLYSQIAAALLTGLGRIPAMSAMNSMLAVVTPAALIPAVVIGGTAVWAVAAWLLATTLFAVVFFVYIARNVCMPAVPTRKSLRRVLTFGAAGWIGTLSHQGFLRVDVYIIAAQSGPAAVGIYSLASVIAEKISMLGQAVYGATARQVGSSEREEAAQLTAQVVRLLCAVMVPAAIVAGAVSTVAFPLIFGQDFDAAAVPFMLLLPGTVALTLWYVVSLFVVSTLKRPGITTMIQAGTLVASLPLYYFAIQAWGMRGAAAASSLVYVAVFVLGAVVLVQNSRVAAVELIPRPADITLLNSLRRREGAQ